jgi:hypothetical protein
MQLLFSLAQAMTVGGIPVGKLAIATGQFLMICIIQTFRNVLSLRGDFFVCYVTRAQN